VVGFNRVMGRASGPGTRMGSAAAPMRRRRRGGASMYYLVPYKILRLVSSQYNPPEFPVRGIA